MPKNKKADGSAYRVGKGAHVGAVKLEDGFENIELTQADLIKVLTTHRVRDKKDGVYITRPMLKGDHSRSDANAGAWRLVPMDLDELQPDELDAVKRWFDESKITGVISSTFSHRPDHPKVRMMLFASREVQAEEHAFVYRALERMVPFKLDPCMAKPSQPIFLPACPQDKLPHAFASFIDGEPLDIDRLLEAYREEIERDTQDRASMIAAGQQVGVRQPGGLLEWFNANYDLVSLLTEKGYKRRSLNRFVAPRSMSGRAAVVVYDNKSVVSFHDPSHDPLAVRNKNHQAIVLDTFSVYCKLQHSDDFKKAYQGALSIARSSGWEGAAALDKQEHIPKAPAVILTAEDLYGYLQPQDMLIEDLLDTNTVTIVSGDSNSGKTTVLQLLALQVAMGEPFAHKRTRQGIVLWIAGEDITNAMYRMVAMCEEYGIDATTLQDNFLLLPQPIAILDADSMLSLHDALRTRIGTRELSLVVVDSKSVNWGGKDENSNDENAQFVAAVRKFLIAPFGRPAAVITHHLTKHREKEVKTSRGGGALINNADHEWRFEMNQEAKISAMAPGSKVRMERWPELRFSIKTVELPEAKLPHLRNNFGQMPRVSIADPVNQYARSMKQLQHDADLRALLQSLEATTAKPDSDTGTTAIARDLGWYDGAQSPDYRRVKRILDLAVKQKLVIKKEKGKAHAITDAGKSYIHDDSLSAAAADDESSEEC